MFCSCCCLLDSIEKPIPVLELRADLSNRKVPSNLNGMLTFDADYDILECR